MQANQWKARIIESGPHCMDAGPENDLFVGFTFDEVHEILIWYNILPIILVLIIFRSLVPTLSESAT